MRRPNAVAECSGLRPPELRMSDKRIADELVSVRSENEARFGHNFLKQVVCEFRFPTLVDLGTQKPPVSLVKALRRDYPILDSASEFTLSIGSPTAGTSRAHVFRASRGGWAVSLKDSSISLETKSYPGFKTFRERIAAVVAAASEIIDSDFFTRIGLRYINVIDHPHDPVRGWINSDLVAPLLSGSFRGVSDYGGKLQMTADDGGCLLQHGLKVATERAGDISLNYTIDIDCYRNESPVSEAVGLVDNLHRQAFDIFDWALGPDARAHLSSSLAKN